ncbi:hypothetical protein DFP73DRAFT_37273 [Morchella snyderi]|nr:hypothetical protein DFP73DRAFT_37273 [Morchella snyderi]
MIVIVGRSVIYKITASSPLRFSTFPLSLFSSKAAVISLLTSPSSPPPPPFPHPFPQTPPHTPHLHLQRLRLHTTFDVSSAEVVFLLLSFFPFHYCLLFIYYWWTIYYYHSYCFIHSTNILDYILHFIYPIPSIGFWSVSCLVARSTTIFNSACCLIFSFLLL